MFDRSTVLEFSSTGSAVVVVVPTQAARYTGPIATVGTVAMGIMGPIVVGLFFIGFLAGGGAGRIVVAEYVPRAAVGGRIPIGRGSSLALRSETIFSPGEATQRDIRWSSNGDVSDRFFVTHLVRATGRWGIITFSPITSVLGPSWKCTFEGVP